MKKILQGFIPLLIISFLVSCNGNPFMNNIFSGVDVYELPDSFGSTGEILDEAGDDGFLDALAEDEELAAEVIATLEESLPDDPAQATSEDQEAALLLADVHLATSEADETINNVNDLLVEAVNDPESLNFDNPEDVVADLFQVDMTQTQAEQEAAVAEQLEAFLAAADALDFYGDTIIAGSDPSSEVNDGETAATAMIAGMTAYMVANVDSGDGTTPMSEQDAIDAIAQSIVSGDPMPAMLADDSVDNAATTEEMLEAMLGDGLTEVVSQGFDLSSFENM